ncbi:hypothetical protein ACVNP1_16000 [Staphylococcus aureus]
MDLLKLDLWLWCVGAINLINAVNDYANEIILLIEMMILA